MCHTAGVSAQRHPAGIQVRREHAAHQAEELRGPAQRHLARQEGTAVATAAATVLSISIIVN